MRQLPAWVVLAFAPVGGCATYNSLGSVDGSPIYAGTRLDAQIVSENLNRDPERARAEGLERPVLVMAACYGLIDMPLSMAADTALLPVTVPLALARPAADPKDSATAGAPSAPR